MLYPRLTNYYTEATITKLLSDIDDKLTKYAVAQYNNIVFNANNTVNGGVIKDLLNYKRILTYKQCNPAYCEAYSVDMIGSRVIVLINK